MKNNILFHYTLLDLFALFQLYFCLHRPKKMAKRFYFTYTHKLEKCLRDHRKNNFNVR